jgi:hypothetical protein
MDELGVHAGEWSALPCGSAAPPPRNGTIPLQSEVITHAHTLPPSSPLLLAELELEVAGFPGWFEDPVTHLRVGGRNKIVPDYRACAC